MNKMSSKKIVFLLAAAIIILCSLPHASFAQTNPQTTCAAGTTCFVPLAIYTKSPQFTNAFNSTSGGLPQYINNAFTIALSIGAILAVLRIAYAGYMYMGSADMWSNKQRAREMLGDAIIGLLLLFGIYLILNQIDPNILNLNILKDITPASQQTPAQQLQGGTQPL